MVAGAIEDESCVTTCRHLAADSSEMQRHGLGVRGRHDQACCDATLRRQYYPQLPSYDHFMAKEDLSLESEATEDELDAGSGKCKSELVEDSQNEVCNISTHLRHHSL
jgi:hypothetical protein